MNKGLRHKVKVWGYIRRLRRLGLYDSGRVVNPRGVGYNLTGFRSSGKPCSCDMCSYSKYKRSKVREDVYGAILEGLQEFEHRYDEDWEQDDIVGRAMYWE